MNNTATNTGPLRPRPTVNIKAAEAHRARRKWAERRFQAYGLSAIAIAGLVLLFLVGDIVFKAFPAVTQSHVTLDVPITGDLVDRADVKSGDFDGLVRNALRAQFPAVERRVERKALDSIVSQAASDLIRRAVIADPSLIGKSMKIDSLLSSDADLLVKGLASRTLIAAGGGGAQPVISENAASISFEPGALSKVRDSLALKSADVTTLNSAQPSLIVLLNGGAIKATTIGADTIEGEVLVPLATTDAVGDGGWKTAVLQTPEGNRKITDKQAVFVTMLQEKGLIQRSPNWTFLTEGDSREPEQAGILGALVGSALTMLVTLSLCLPIGVGAAIYLEAFAPKNALSHFIEVNINNLAAVPSIVFGLLGLAIFLNFAGMPRSSALVGGLVLALLVLPTIIIASRAAIRSVPPSIAEAALALGATRQQAVFHHVLPVALPGIMTGTIIGMAHALGETAPLLMIGMVAFIADVPGSLTEAATVMPVQIFLWSDLPEVGFQARTAAAILVLLIFLVAMNGIAILLRRKFERRW